MSLLRLVFPALSTWRGMVLVGGAAPSHLKSDGREPAIAQNDHNHLHVEWFDTRRGWWAFAANNLLARLCATIMQTRLVIGGVRNHEVWVWNRLDQFGPDDSPGPVAWIAYPVLRCCSRDAAGFDAMKRAFPSSKGLSAWRYDGDPASPRLVPASDVRRLVGGGANRGALCRVSELARAD